MALVLENGQIEAQHGLLGSLEDLEEDSTASHQNAGDVHLPIVPSCGYEDLLDVPTGGGRGGLAEVK
jgi:hypothetical protein